MNLTSKDGLQITKEDMITARAQGNKKIRSLRDL
jgi:hypothetical protein